MDRYACPDDQKIVVRGLPSGTQRATIEEYFSRIGRVVDLWTKDSGRDVFGFVGFESKAAYETALTHHGATLNGATLRIEPKQSGGRPASGMPDRDANKVVVHGLAPTTTDEDVQAFFGAIGPINDYYRRPGAEFCFVGFEDALSFAEALRATGQDLAGSRISVSVKEARNSYHHGGGRGGNGGGVSFGGGRGRGRGGSYRGGAYNNNNNNGYNPRGGYAAGGPFNY